MGYPADCDECNKTFDCDELGRWTKDGKERLICLDCYEYKVCYKYFVVGMLSALATLLVVLYFIGGRF